MRTVRSTRRVVNPPQLDQEGPGRVTPMAALAEPAVSFLPKRLEGEVPPPSHGARLRVRATSRPPSNQ